MFALIPIIIFTPLAGTAPARLLGIILFKDVLKQ